MTAQLVYANANDFQVLDLHDRPQDGDVSAEVVRLYKQHGVVVRGELWDRATEGRIRGENYPEALAEQRERNWADLGVNKLDVQLAHSAVDGRGQLAASGVIRAGVRVK